VALTHDERDAARCGSCRQALPRPAAAERPQRVGAPTGIGWAWVWPFVFFVVGAAVFGATTGALAEMAFHQGGARKDTCDQFMGDAFAGGLMFSIVGVLVARFHRETKAPGPRMLAVASVTVGCCVLCLVGVKGMGAWPILAGGPAGIALARVVGLASVRPR
jgi:hypothetical protein